MSKHPIWTALRYRFEYAAFHTIGLLFGALPIETASQVSGWLWRQLAPLSRRHARALANLARAFPEKERSEHERIARSMWDNLGRTFGESFHLAEIAASTRVIFENADVLEHWAEADGGKVACAGHLGNWELAILGIIQAGAKPWTIYRPAKNPLVDAEILELRRALYTQGGLLPKSPTLPRTCLRLVKEGSTVGLLADQRDRTGTAVPLFGVPAHSTIFPALLARSIEAPILLVRMRRLAGARFVQSFELLHGPVTDDRKADITATTALVQSSFERYIRDAPEQWMWAHRRWG